VPTPKVIIMLMPHRIDVVVTGPQGASESIALPAPGLPADPDAWMHAISTLVGPVGQAAVRMGIRGARTTILYRSPFQATDVSVFPVTSLADSAEGARLALLESLPGAALATVTDTFALGTDTHEGVTRQHVVASGDREDVLNALHKLIVEAGLRFESAVPIDAAISILVARQTLRGKTRTTCLLHIGESASFITARIGDATVLARRIGFGTATMAAALTRPIIRPGDDVEVSLSTEAAAAMLASVGIPDRDHVVDETTELRGRDVLPLLQPALQRLMVEVRQSIRFGVHEEHHRDLTIELCGPGARIRGLDRVIQEECGLPVHVARSDENAGTMTDAATLLEHPISITGIALRPVAIEQSRRTASFRRRIWLGAAAAMMLVAFDGVRRHAIISELEQRHAAATSYTADADADHARRTVIVNALSTVHATEAHIHRTHGGTPDLHASMQELSLIIPESIRFTSIAFRTVQDRMVGDIAGISRGTGDDGSEQLTRFVRALEESPLFEHVVLGNIQAAHFGTAEGLRFSISFAAANLPARHHLIASGEEAHADNH